MIQGREVTSCAGACRGYVDVGNDQLRVSQHVITGCILLSLIAALYMFVRYCSPFLPMFLRCLMLMGPVELLFLLFLIDARTCSVVMFICVGCRLSTFQVIFLFVVLVL